MSKRLQIYLLVIFQLVLQQNGVGQEMGMWHLTDEDGLPSMTVYHTAQDNKGYIWIATSKGICRFDGKTFQSFKSPEFNDNEILKIEIDDFGRIWFRNLSGQLFYIKDEVIHNAKHLFNEDLQEVYDFILDDQNTIWVSFRVDGQQGATYTVARLMVDSTGAFSPLSITGDGFPMVNPFKRDEASILLIASMREGPSRLVEVEKETNTLVEVDTILNIRNGLSFYFKYKEQLYLQAGINNKQVFELNRAYPNPYLTFNHKVLINSISIIENNFWILTRQGLFIQPLNNQDTAKEQHLLDNTSLNHLMIDHEGNKWMSTMGNGIYVITAPQMSVFQTSNFNLLSDKIYSLEYDATQKKLLVGYDGGKVSILDEQLNNRPLAVRSSGRITDIFVDHNSDTWLGSDTECLILNPDFSVKKRTPQVVKQILVTKNDFLLLGTGPSFLKLKKEDYLSPTYLKRQEKILSEKTYAILEDFSGNIWVGTTVGIFLYKDTIVPFLENDKQLPYNISSISQTTDSVIWVATRGNGVIGIKDQQIHYRFNEENGLASNIVEKVHSTEGHLWVGTDNGLNKFDLKTKQWEWINTTDGLPSNEINTIENVGDQIWIGTPKGLVRFPANAVYSNAIQPPIHISAILLEEKDTVVLDSFFLPYDQNNIQVEFTGIGYKGKGKLSYEYKMSGIDEQWVSTDSRFARYPKLAPGDYRFEVFAINEDRVKSENPASVSFYIDPPWWQTWWFRILSAFIVFGVAGLVVNARIQRQKREQFYLNHVNELKTKALQAQMNPHFIFNALNAIQKFIVTNNREQAMNYLSRFGKLIRLIFEHSQYEKITLEEELEFLDLYLSLEKLRFMDEVNIQLEVSPELLDISDEIHLPPLLIQPIIENAFKHGFMYKNKKGILKINFSGKDAYLICAIEDNGIGRKKAAALGQETLKDRRSSGLKTTVERLKINNQQYNLGQEKNVDIVDLFDGNKTVAGTLVELKIYCLGLTE